MIEPKLALHPVMLHWLVMWIQKGKRITVPQLILLVNHNGYPCFLATKELHPMLRNNHKETNLEIQGVIRTGKCKYVSYHIASKY